MSKHCIVAVSPNSWGRGSTVEEAKKQLVKAGGKAAGCKLRFIYGCDKAYVNSMGDLMLHDGAESFKIGGPL